MIVFMDDFEEKFAPWDEITTVYASVPPVVTMGNAHHGDYKAVFADSFEGHCYKKFSPRSRINHRWQWRVSALPAVATEHVILGRIGVWGGYALHWLELYFDGADCLFRIGYRHNNTEVMANSALLTNPSINTWHTAELQTIIGSSASYRTLIDGTLLTDITQTSKNQMTPIDFIGVEADQNHLTAVIQVWADCVKVTDDAETIGTEVTNAPIVYPTTSVAESSALPSTSSAVVQNYGARCRHLRHRTAISPWKASS